jgi:prevent-host-death family protein
MVSIGITEAKTKFSALLNRAQRGQQILITRRGKPVARLMPIETTRKGQRSVAMERLRELRKGTALGNLNWREVRDAGRKY